MDVSENPLAAENQRLRDRITELEKKYSALMGTVRHLRGSAGEHQAVRLTMAKQVFGNKDHDLIYFDQAIGDWVTIEVKRSGGKSRHYKRGTKTGRHSTPSVGWSWTKVFGSSGYKDYNRIWLIAEFNEHNRAYAHLYADPADKFIIFDLSISVARQLTKSRTGDLWLNADPNIRRKDRGPQKELWKCLVTVAELKSRYGAGGADQGSACFRDSAVLAEAPMLAKERYPSTPTLFEC